MRVETTHTNVYTFKELSDEAKQKAIDNNRDFDTRHEWYDSDLDGFKAIGEILGISIDEIYFSGFSSQGDGLCFTGRFEYSKDWRRRLDAYAPKTWECPECGRVHENENNKGLHAIGERLQAEQRRAFYGVNGTIEHRGHYNHSGCTLFDVRGSSWDYEVNAKFDPEDIKQVYRELMDTFYHMLNRQYDYLTSDDYIRDRLEEYDGEYLADGSNY